MMKLVTTLTQSDANHPPLVLIHGLGSAATAFKPIIPELSKSFRVITVDLPGHGQTPFDPLQPMDPKSLGRAIFDTVENEYGVAKFHVAGNSLGGWISLELASLSPQNIKSVTGLAPAGLWLAPYSARYPGTAVAKALAKAIKVVAPLVVDIEYARKVGFADVSPRWKDFSKEICLDATMAMATSAGYYPAWDGMLKRRFDSPINSDIPVTVIFGDSDKTLPASNCQERSLTPNHAQWFIFEETGHAPMWDSPQLCIEKIIETTGIAK
jgi:pimeloyl-ACP methyl ester carboxylesterase